MSDSHSSGPNSAHSTALALLTAASDWLWEWGVGGVLVAVRPARGEVPHAVRACVAHPLDPSGWHFMMHHGQPVTAQALVKARASFSVQCTIHHDGHTLAFELTGVPVEGGGGTVQTVGCARQIGAKEAGFVLPARADGMRPAPDPLEPRWTWEPDRDTLSLSPSLTRELPAPSHGARAWWLEVLGDESFELFSIAVHRCREEGELLSMELPVRSRFGERWMHLTGHRLVRNTGRASIEGRLEDIHEQRRLRLTGEAAAERHQRLFAEMTIACLVYDLRTLEWLEVNPAAEQLYGYRHTEFLALGVRDVLDASEHDRLASSIRQPAGSHGTGGDEWLHRHCDGHRLHVQVRTSDVLWDGRPARMIFVVDASELRASAIEIRMLYDCLEHARDMVLVTTAVPDAQGSRAIVYVNRAFELRTGYSRHEVLGRDPRILQGAATSAATVDTVRGRLSRFAPVDVEMINYDKQGNPYWVELSISPVADGQGQYHYMFAVERDITQRKLAVNQLAEQARELELRVEQRTHELTESVKALEAFSRSVSHDLLNPVNGVLGFSELLLKNHAAGLSADAARMLVMIQRSGQRMRTIIDDLLSLARVRRVECRPVTVDAGALAKQMFDDLCSTQPERRAALDVAPQSTLCCDLQLFRIVLDNLLTNGWKYTGRRPETRLRLSVSRVEGGALVSIEDNGAGFDPCGARDLFGTFKRLHRDAEFTGNGIGLATVAQAVDRMGGWVWAESTPDLGAAFHVFLPSAEAARVTTTASSSSEAVGLAVLDQRSSTP